MFVPAIATIPESITDKVQKLIRLLSSDNDGEVVASAHALIRTLEGEGLDIHVLAASVSSGSERVTQASWRGGRTVGYREGYSSGFADGQRKQANGQRRPPVEDEPDDFDDDELDWYRIARECAERPELLRANEQSFIANMTKWSQRPSWRPSEAQQKWLLDIWRRRKRK
jgi:hypothetical protein